MIDIENKILSVVRDAVLAQYPDACVYGEYVQTPDHFPCVTVTEETNYTYTRSLDAELGEHHTEVQYAINVYSDKQSGAKLEARKILAIADSAMLGLRFYRTMSRQVPNIDRTIYRVLARYHAVVSVPVESGNDLVYEIFQK